MLQFECKYEHIFPEEAYENFVEKNNENFHKQKSAQNTFPTFTKSLALCDTI
jgi:hypothetical protein